MNNKVLVELKVPSIDEVYNIYLPINIKVGTAIALLNKALSDITQGLYQARTTNFLYSQNSGVKYNIDDIIVNTDIRNGSTVVLY